MRPLLLLLLAIGAVARGAERLTRPLDRPEWLLHLPADFEPNANGAVDLLVHFHGRPSVVVDNAEQAGLNAAVVTVNYRGLSSVYRAPFSDPQLFAELLEQTDAALRRHLGSDAHRGRVCVSSFSAGYGAVREILKQPRYVAAIAGLLAADSLYASTAADGTPEDAQMAPYKAFAELAVAGDKVFVVTHTEVATPNYESTRETADELLAHLGLQTARVDRGGVGPPRFTRHANAGGFSVWGSPGATAEAHMNHLRCMAEWLDDLPLATVKASTTGSQNPTPKTTGGP